MHARLGDLRARPRINISRARSAAPISGGEVERILSMVDGGAGAGRCGRRADAAEPSSSSPARRCAAGPAADRRRSSNSDRTGPTCPPGGGAQRDFRPLRAARCGRAPARFPDPVRLGHYRDRLGGGRHGSRCSAQEHDAMLDIIVKQYLPPPKTNPDGRRSRCWRRRSTGPLWVDVLTDAIHSGVARLNIPVGRGKLRTAGLSSRRR